jgi:hypothetical protein
MVKHIAHNGCMIVRFYQRPSTDKVNKRQNRHVRLKNYTFFNALSVTIYNYDVE